MTQTKHFALPLLALIAFFALTPHVFAQASTVTTLTSPPQGLQVLPTSNANTASFEAMWSTIQADALANGGVTVGPYNCPQCNPQVPNGWRPFADSKAARSITPTTLNRICYLADPTSTYHSFQTDDNWTGGTGDGKVIFYNLFGDNLWHYKQASAGNGCPSLTQACHYALWGANTASALVCYSYAPPSNTDWASSYNINPGDAVQLYWDDTAVHDNLLRNARAYANGNDSQTKYPFYDVGALGPLNQCSASALDSSNNPVSFPIPSTTTTYNGCNGPENCSDFLKSCTGYFCGVADQETDSYTILNNSYTIAGPITATPPVTTTYTYSCTNPNGTTIANAKINVGPLTQISVSCAASPNPASGVNTNVTWSVGSVNGGSPPAPSSRWVYQWSGSAISGATNTADPGSATSFVKQYGSGGTYYGYLKVTDNNSGISSALTPCTSALSVPPVSSLSASCTVDPPLAATGAQVTWQASASGGVSPYTYAWNGGATAGTPIAPSTFSSQTLKETYSTAGTYNGTVTVTDSATPTHATKTSLNCTNSNNTTGVVVADPPLCTFSVSPPSVYIGNSVNLTWNCANATSCSAVSGTGYTPFTVSNCTTNCADNNEIPPGPAGTNNLYGLSCAGPGGTWSNAQSVQVKSPDSSISANPTIVARGGSSALSWTGNDVKSCTVTASDGVHPATTVASWTDDGTHTYADTATVTVNARTTYTIICVAVAGSDPSPASTIVNVQPAFNPF